MMQYVESHPQAPMWWFLRVVVNVSIFHPDWSSLPYVVDFLTCLCFQRGLKPPDMLYLFSSHFTK